MEDLLALHGDALRRANTQSNLVAFNAQHGDRNLVPDHHRFTDSTGQD
jgi:hypothetical protein